MIALKYYIPEIWQNSLSMCEDNYMPCSYKDLYENLLKVLQIMSILLQIFLVKIKRSLHWFIEIASLCRFRININN